jgi:hypothetical protein
MRIAVEAVEYHVTVLTYLSVREHAILGGVGALGRVPGSGLLQEVQHALHQPGNGAVHHQFVTPYRNSTRNATEAAAAAAAAAAAVVAATTTTTTMKTMTTTTTTTT